MLLSLNSVYRLLAKALDAREVYFKDNVGIHVTRTCPYCGHNLGAALPLGETFGMATHCVVRCGCGQLVKYWG